MLLSANRIRVIDKYEFYTLARLLGPRPTNSVSAPKTSFARLNSNYSFNEKRNNYVTRRIALLT